MAFVIAHLSDPHLGPLPRPQWADLATKRALGYLNWYRGRKRVHRPDVLAKILDDVRSAAPDHIVVTGDLTNLALASECANARAWLEQLGTPERVTIVPGNHDAYVPDALSHAMSLWGPYLAGDELAKAETNRRDAFPFIRRRGPVALIGVSTATATRPFMASGHVNGRQLIRLADDLVCLSREGLFRIVLMHHPLEVTRKHWAKRLINSGSVRTILTTAGAELVLHGHMHVPSLISIAGPKAPINVFAVPSASAAPDSKFSPAGYALHSIEPLGEEGFRWSYQRRTLNQDGHIESSEQVSLILPQARA